MGDKIIIPSKKFKKNIEKRFSEQKIEKKIKEKLELFKSDRNNYLLRDHSLKGILNGYRAFSVTSDIRIIYKEEKENCFILIDIGTHTQVYDM